LSFLRRRPPGLGWLCSLLGLRSLGLGGYHLQASAGSNHWGGGTDAVKGVRNPAGGAQGRCVAGTGSGALQFTPSWPAWAGRISVSSEGAMSGGPEGLTPDFAL